MKFKINEEKCIGCGICHSICPDCFSMQGGLAKVTEKNECNCQSKEIIESCPCLAIEIKNND